MSYEPQLESVGHFRIPAEGKLMSAVQHRGSEITVRLGIVECTDSEVLVRGQRGGRAVAEAPATVFEAR